MVEGPESTFLAIYIQKHFINKKLKNITIRRGRYKHHGPPERFNHFRKALPLRLLEVYKKGKVIFLFFEDNWTLIAKLGMVGWFHKPIHVPIYESKENIVFHFENDELNFTDFRNFGTLTFTDDVFTVINEMDAIAPDILDKMTTFHTIIQRLPKKSTLTIDEALINQGLIFSGIGNIIKSEVLYDSKISPHRGLDTLTHNDWRTIYRSAKKISQKILHILLLQDTIDTNMYSKSRKIYQREYDPDGRPIMSYISGNGRRTFWVPEIQK